MAVLHGRDVLGVVVEHPAAMALPEIELITVRAAERAGVTRRSLARSAERGELVHLRRGVYLPSTQWEELDETERHLVTLKALFVTTERPLVVSHWSAAVLHGLPVLRKRLAALEVTVPSGSSRSLAGARARDGELRATEIEIVDGLPVTTQQRTVLDLASTAPFAEGVIAADAALHRRHPDEREALRAALLEAWTEAPQLRSVIRVRRVLEFADGGAESAGESVSRVTMHAIGLPAPVLQREFWDARGFAGRSDFWFPDEDVIGEMDGHAKYLDPRMSAGDPAGVVLQEKQREDRLRRLVRGFVRWEWADAVSTTRLAAKLAAAGVRPTSL